MAVSRGGSAPCPCPCGGVKLKVVAAAVITAASVSHSRSSWRHRPSEVCSCWPIPRPRVHKPRRDVHIVGPRFPLVLAVRVDGLWDGCESRSSASKADFFSAASTAEEYCRLKLREAELLDAPTTVLQVW